MMAEYYFHTYNAREGHILRANILEVQGLNSGSDKMFLLKIYKIENIYKYIEVYYFKIKI